MRNVVLALVVAGGLLMFGCGGGGGGSDTDDGGSGQTNVQVTGRVLDSANAPVSGATVTITSTPIVATTDAIGGFMATIVPGEHLLAIAKGGVKFCEMSFVASAGSPVFFGDILPTLPYYQSGGQWVGNWVQVNFLGTDDNGNVEQWDSDSTDPEGIGFVADVSENEWVERDEYGNGCAAVYSFSVNGDRYSMRGKSTNCYFPGDFTKYTDSGRLEFQDSNIMIQWYDYPPGATNEIVAFKWKRK
ncbi:MAG: carboxypeptidase regulatory-like domain-containing protein [Deltaproteobacteria bacterium]|nr:carboxypeptidase regulatory-like domain-containing protein [Deltaproteobacteria bacterium]